MAINTPKWKVGDPVILHKSKRSEHPGPRAENVHAAAHGELYSYTVEKFWLIKEVHEDHTLTLVTRTGKEHRLEANDSRLRAPNFIERIRYKGRFPQA